MIKGWYPDLGERDRKSADFAAVPSSFTIRSIARRYQHDTTQQERAPHRDHGACCVVVSPGVRRGRNDHDSNDDHIVLHDVIIDSIDDVLAFDHDFFDDHVGRR
jgi:hypothetical protein